MSRRFASTVAALGAAGALLVAAGAFWVQRDVLDSDRFAHHVRQALTHEAVRALVADEIADQTGAAASEQVEAVVGSEAFAGPFEAAVAEAHRGFVEGGGDAPVVDLSPVEDEVRAAVPGALPEGTLDAVPIGDRGDYPDLSPVDACVDTLFSTAMLTAIALVVLAFALARPHERHRVAVAGGLGLAAGAVVAYLAAAALPGTVAGRAGRPLVRDAVGAVVEAMVSGLRWEAGALAVLGVALVLLGLAWGARPRTARVV